MLRKYASVDKESCVACGSCLEVCRKYAISIIDGCFAEVDIKKCVGCTLCKKICPASVINMRDVSMCE